jgi:hypothetical protein
MIVDCERSAEKQAAAAKSAPVAPAASSGVNAGEVLTGIGAILAPLAQVGVSIYAAQQQSKLAKMQMKYGRQQSSAPSPPMYFPPPPPKKSPVLMIVIVLVVIMMAGGMFFMMQGGDAPATASGGGGGYAPAPSGGLPNTIAPAPAAPRITKVKRVRRRRGRRRP